MSAPTGGNARACMAEDHGMSKRWPLIVGNWKMNGRVYDLTEAVETAQALPAAGVEVVLCPPFPLLGAFAGPLAGTRLGLGAQDVDHRPDGAHTGCVSAAMIADLGARFAILGHSERRQDHGETDALVRAKAEAALEAGLTAIICVGETLEEREEGRAEAVVRAQIAGSTPKGRVEQIAIAYEPVWAIGSGRTPTAQEIASVHTAARQAARAAVGADEAPRILYGGSVKPQNAAQIFAIPEVEGALVGGASLKAADFLAIIRAHPAAALSGE